MPPNEDHCPRGIKMEERAPLKPSGQYGSSDRLGPEIDLGKNPPVASSPLHFSCTTAFLSSSSWSRGQRWSLLAAVGRHCPPRRIPVFAFVLAKKDQVPWRGCEKLEEEEEEEQEKEVEVEVDEEEEEEEEGEEENEAREKSDGREERKDEGTTTRNCSNGGDGGAGSSLVLLQVCLFIQHTELLLSSHPPPPHSKLHEGYPRKSISEAKCTRADACIPTGMPRWELNLLN
ncbi:hypothetical protein X777_06813 [Ooceraea biroi]|uniref:Uncharacterized protein n=1 Tax=Ooceraea biroi TaxID=2015173 RepID=A0A026WDG6_OOCBI|nr:hypothetical protein X777_06813 [Ooceraea biroi]